MGNFSRDTFDRLKHYVGVRLQQGVPLVDADWNEQEDIRKYELQAFLKWFVGDGVPAENRGFLIEPIDQGQVGYLVITAATGAIPSSLEFDHDTASLFSFYYDNEPRIVRTDGPASWRSDYQPPIGINTNMRFRVAADGQPFEELQFQAADFADPNSATIEELVRVLNRDLRNVRATISGTPNDILIAGQDNADNIGRCIIDGWDVLIERSLRYTEQALYNNPELAARWNVDPLPPLSPPGPNEESRRDLVYLDVWEREVGAEEDPFLVNPLIGIETSVRIKREWVVRVLEGYSEDSEDLSPQLPPAPPGHVYMALARFDRYANQPYIGNNGNIIDDLRRPLFTLPHLSQQVGDLQSRVGSLDHSLRTLVQETMGVNNGISPDLPLSLRETINALLRGQLPQTAPRRILDKVPENSSTGRAKAITANSGTWFFYSLEQFNNNTANIFAVNRFDPRPTFSWSAPGVVAAHKGDFFVLLDTDNQPWLFYTNEDNTQIQHSKFRSGARPWNSASFGAIEGVSGIQLQAATSDPNGNLWIFWQGRRNNQPFSNYLHRPIATRAWTSGSASLLPEANAAILAAQATKGGDVWLFYREATANGRLGYGRYRAATRGWEWNRAGVIQAPGSSFSFLTVHEDPAGNIWIAWMDSVQQSGTQLRMQYFSDAVQRWVSAGETAWSWQFSNSFIHNLTILFDPDGLLRLFWLEHANSQVVIGYGQLSLSQVGGEAQISQPASPTRLTIAGDIAWLALTRERAQALSLFWSLGYYSEAGIWTAQVITEL